MFHVCKNFPLETHLPRTNQRYGSWIYLCGPTWERRRVYEVPVPEGILARVGFCFLPCSTSPCIPELGQLIWIQMNVLYYKCLGSSFKFGDTVVTQRKYDYRDCLLFISIFLWSNEFHTMFFCLKLSPTKAYDNITTQKHSARLFFKCFQPKFQVANDTNIFI